ncbi:MAG: aldose 1-epimerase family protein [Planctomycetales bacterium]|nr:aldose 1-epimerase family protein [Planctomycetales bacterium]
MAVYRWILTDREQAISVSAGQIGPSEVAGSPTNWSVKKQTLACGKSAGVESIEIDNGKICLVVIPTRGMNLWKATAGEKTLGWRSPVDGPVHPAFVPLAEPSGLGWLDGFDELLVRCGLESNGAPEFNDNGSLRYGLHGRIANLPAHHVSVSVDADGISVTGEVDETRFHFQKLRLTTTLKIPFGKAAFSLHDEVTNLGGAAKPMQMLYHFNIGRPLLDAGSRLVAPVKTLVPRNDHAAKDVAAYDSYLDEQAGYEEQVYFFDLHADAAGATQSMIKNAHGTEGVSVRFNKKQLPCFTQWKDTMAGADGYVTGMEPATNFPNPRSFEGEQRREVVLEPGQSQAFDLDFAWHLSADEVQRAEAAIAELQQAGAPKIHETPQPGWCA